MQIVTLFFAAIELDLQRNFYLFILTKRFSMKSSVKMRKAVAFKKKELVLDCEQI